MCKNLVTLYIFHSFFYIQISKSWQILVIRKMLQDCQLWRVAANFSLYSLLYSTFLVFFQRINEFGELFLKSLQTHGILCLGLYRLHTTQTVSLKSLSTRYVITFPHRHMALEPTDLIFGLIPFGRSPNQNHYVES